jgi:cell division protein FtsW (lipid II flippase)
VKNWDNSVTQPSPSRSLELSLLALAWIITTSFYVLASLGAKGHLPTRIWLFLGAVVLVTLGMHLVIRKLAPRSSQVLLPVATLLNGLGYVEIARWNPTRAAYQAAWFFISALGLVATLWFVRRTKDLDRFRYITLVLALGLLIVPLVPGIGISVYGARLWVGLGPVTFQPVELSKILLVFFFASYFATNRNLLSTPSQRLGGRTIVPPKVLLPILAAWGFSLAVLGAENDIGFAMLLFTLFIAMLWLATGLRTYVAMGVTLLVAGMYLASKFFTQVHQRVSLWLDPWSAHNLAFSHQLAYGWFSLAAGGVTGTGLGLGQSGNIPEITSDMIFVAVGEELGFLGLILVVSLFVVFVGEGFRIAQRASNDFVRLAAAGLSALMGFQAFFIMAGVLRLLPFTGITVPFMAYGGSSLFSNYIIVALLLRISDENAAERRGGAVLAMTFD